MSPHLSSCSEKVNLDGLLLRPLHYQFLQRLNEQYGLAGKTILEVGSDLNMQVAQAFLRYGAAGVWATNPRFPLETEAPHPAIHKVASCGEDTNMPDKHFDVIFGVALLEHVNNPKKLATECKRMLKQNGICFLQGNPLWPSPQGHHTFLKDLYPWGATFRFDDESSPYYNWEHLTIETDEQLLHALKKRGIDIIYLKELSYSLFHDLSVSRLSASQIITEFESVDGLDMKIIKHFTPKQPNAFFNEALAKYSEEDLKTYNIEIIISHKINNKSINS